MKNILIFMAFITCIGGADAAVRDGNTAARTTAGGGQSTQQRVSTIQKSERTTSNNGTVLKRPATSATNTTRNTTARNATNASTSARNVNTQSRTATPRATASQSRATATPTRNSSPVVLSARAATQSTANNTSETRTGAEYERCKSAYFTCMDQFCQLKNDDYRRCSCSSRVIELGKIREVLQHAGEQITVFNENLDVVGMTAAQATAMRTASDGENALTSDTSASKALLQAIMNSIRGGDTNVGGKYSDLNSINISFDTTNAFGTLDAGQAVAAYNGQDLYSAVYPQCRNAVRADCNNASLQRAITAYLMAIEQDCNTVQTAIENKQKETKSALRESSAMLDLARVENRQKHNSDDITTCLANVESAILSEEVCGAGYHKCLDNGEFIDVSTGAPIAGVVRFYELKNLLTFNQDVDITDQQLSKIRDNRTFVQNFEKRVKKFAEPALNKCVEQADFVWEEYLDKAMRDIYYAQESKVSEIKQGCFDFVSTCYMNGETALTTAMQELTGDSNIVLQPDTLALNNQLCKNYVDSCTNMFGTNIIAEYIKERQDTDTLAACRAVVKQCFDKFGGSGYENFYYPHSGLITAEQAANWFTLYELSGDPANPTKEYKSECAKQLAQIDACKDSEMMEKAFGGFDLIAAGKGSTQNGVVYYFDPDGKYMRWGQLNSNPDSDVQTADNQTIAAHTLRDRILRPTGVATEVYNQIIDILTTQCINMQGRFVEVQFIHDRTYDEENFCRATFETSLAYNSTQKAAPSLMTIYGIAQGENMCPRNYSLGVDTQSWGACLCWENGGRRSKNGQSTKCVASIPVNTAAKDANCRETNETKSGYELRKVSENDNADKADMWCTQTLISSDNQVCPLTGGISATTGACTINGNAILDLPDGLN